MEINRTDRYIVLTPAEGKVLSNGDTTSTEVYMPLDGDITKWSDIDQPTESEEVEDSVALQELKEVIV